MVGEYLNIVIFVFDHLLGYMIMTRWGIIHDQSWVAKPNACKKDQIMSIESLYNPILPIPWIEKKTKKKYIYIYILQVTLKHKFKFHKIMNNFRMALG